MKHRYLEAGKIVNTHGIAGEVKILPWADDPAFLLDFDTLYIDGQPVSLLGARVHKNCVLAKLAGIHDINEAMKLKNKVVFIDREDAELEEGAFFLADLMGLEVRDADSGEVLGQIADILTPPASNVYVVTGGKQDHMIPAVPEFIVETNIDEGYLRVRLIEGMGTGWIFSITRYSPMWLVTCSVNPSWGVPKSGASFVSIATKFGTIPSTSKSKWTTIPTAAAMGQ